MYKFDCTVSLIWTFEFPPALRVPSSSCASTTTMAAPMISINNICINYMCAI